MNNGVMGSMFTRYKSPALVNLDWTTTFTPELLRKDLDLGLELGREWDVPMPVTAATREVLQTHFGAATLQKNPEEYLQKDFAALMETMALAAGMKLDEREQERPDRIGELSRMIARLDRAIQHAEWRLTNQGRQRALCRKKQILTQVGPGTPMGEYLRRYWQPIGGASELDDNPIKAIRLLGEDLVLYKDLGGRYGLVDRHCPHRRADLSYGFVEETGIRCNYHGWLMDEAGRCIEQPYDDTVNPNSRAKERCTTTAYPVKECAGLLFAYMGPQPVPELPVWEPFTWENGFREVVLSDIPCNWFQCQENSCDPVHFEWMHDNWIAAPQGPERPLCQPSTSSSSSRSSSTASSTSACARTSDESDPYLDHRDASRSGRTASISAITSNGGCRSTTRTRSASAGSSCACRRAASLTCRTRFRPGGARSRTRAAAGSRATSSTRTSSPGSGRARSPTAPRRRWRASDLGIAMIRKRFFDDIDAMARGEEPKGVIRNPNVARCVELPFFQKKESTEGLTLAEHEKYPLLKARLNAFRHCYGQPPQVRRAFEEAMGIAK